MTTPSEAVEIFCVKCKAKTASRDIEAVTMKNGRARHPLHLHRVRHQKVPHRRPALNGSSNPMALATLSSTGRHDENRSGLASRPGHHHARLFSGVSPRERRRWCRTASASWASAASLAETGVGSESASSFPLARASGIGCSILCVAGAFFHLLRLGAGSALLILGFSDLAFGYLGFHRGPPGFDALMLPAHQPGRQYTKRPSGVKVFAHGNVHVGQEHPAHVIPAFPLRDFRREVKRTQLRRGEIDRNPLGSFFGGHG